MQAAMRTVAHWLDRIVTSLPTSGSIAAFASWKSMSAGGKDDQRAGRSRLARRPPAGCRCWWLRRRSPPWARFGIDLLFPDSPEREQGGQDERGGDEEYGLGRHEVTAGAHDAGGKPVADRGKARVAAEPRANRRVADQTKRDGGNSRAQNRARGDVQQLRRDDRHERRRQRDQKRADTYADDGQGAAARCLERA